MKFDNFDIKLDFFKKNAVRYKPRLISQFIRIYLYLKSNSPERYHYPIYIIYNIYIYILTKNEVFKYLHIKPCFLIKNKDRYYYFGQPSFLVKLSRKISTYMRGCFISLANFPKNGHRTHCTVQIGKYFPPPISHPHSGLAKQIDRRSKYHLFRTKKKMIVGFIIGLTKCFKIGLYWPLRRKERLCQMTKT